MIRWYSQLNTRVIGILSTASIKADSPKLFLQCFIHEISKGMQRFYFEGHSTARSLVIRLNPER